MTDKELAKKYFGAISLDEDNFTIIDGWTLAAFRGVEGVQAKFASCKVCFSVVSVDNVIQHAQWHEAEEQRLLEIINFLKTHPYLKG